MSENIEGGTLNIGLLSVDRRKLVSPSNQQPELFTGPYHGFEGISLENEARGTLAERRIIASSQHMLTATPDMVHKGYLLRESTKLDLDEYGLTLFTTHEVTDFLKEAEPESIHGHFLRQIVRWMN